MSVFTQFDTHFSDGFYSGAGQDSGLVGSELGYTHGSGLYHGMPSVDGGVDIYHGGHFVVHQHDDGGSGIQAHGVEHIHHQDGSVETYHHGQLIGKSVPNVHGGMDHYDAHMQLKNSTLPNGIGGEVVYDSHHLMEGTTLPNGLGTDDYLSFSGNAETIIGYQDPLAHAAEYQPHSLGFDNKF